MAYVTIDITIGDHVKYHERIGEMVAEQAEQFIRMKLSSAGLMSDDYIVTIGGD